MGRVRSRRDCPYPSCKAKGLLRLANHLGDVHNLKGAEKAKYLLREVTSSTAPSLKLESVEIRTDNAKMRQERETSSTKALVPLQPRSSLQIIGPTGAGKTLFTKRLIEEVNNMYDEDPPQKVLYCYGVYQPLFDEMEQSLEYVKFYEGLPTEQFIDEFAAGKHTLVVLDDLMQAVLKSDMAERLFVQSCHHKNLSVAFLSQNLYQKGPKAKTISLNCTYLCLFRNVRDKQQIKCLASQMYPGKTDIFMEAYNDCTKAKYGYLFIDLGPHSEEEYRLRTKIFPGEDTIIYLPKD